MINYRAEIQTMADRTIQKRCSDVLRQCSQIRMDSLSPINFRELSALISLVSLTGRQNTILPRLLHPLLSSAELEQQRIARFDPAKFRRQPLRGRIVGDKAFAGWYLLYALPRLKKLATASIYTRLLNVWLSWIDLIADYHVPLLPHNLTVMAAHLLLRASRFVRDERRRFWNESADNILQVQVNACRENSTNYHTLWFFHLILLEQEGLIVIPPARWVLEYCRSVTGYIMESGDVLHYGDAGYGRAGGCYSRLISILAWAARRFREGVFTHYRNLLLNNLLTRARAEQEAETANFSDLTEMFLYPGALAVNLPAPQRSRRRVFNMPDNLVLKTPLRNSSGTLMIPRHSFGYHGHHDSLALNNYYFNGQLLLVDSDYPQRAACYHNRPLILPGRVTPTPERLRALIPEEFERYSRLVSLDYGKKIITVVLRQNQYIYPGVVCTRRTNWSRVTGNLTVTDTFVTPGHATWTIMQLWNAWDIRPLGLNAALLWLADSQKARSSEQGQKALAAFCFGGQGWLVWEDMRSNSSGGKRRWFQCCHYTHIRGQATLATVLAPCSLQSRASVRKQGRKFSILVGNVEESL